MKSSETLQIENILFKLPQQWNHAMMQSVSQNSEYVFEIRCVMILSNFASLRNTRYRNLKRNWICLMGKWTHAIAARKKN